jgi:hypothetical protein
LQESQVIGVNAELFSRDKQNVPMLLGLLEAEPAGVNDFHVRYHALQILTGLSSSPHRLQEVPIHRHSVLYAFLRAPASAASRSSGKNCSSKSTPPYVFGDGIEEAANRADHIGIWGRQGDIAQQW